MPKRSQNYFRPPEEEGELVAILEKNMGNGILQVKVPGSTLMCHVRKKFTKERNALKVGAWLLVGLREFETIKKNCDLLEIYSDTEVNRLLSMDGPWRIFEQKDDLFLEKVDVEKTDVVLDMDINIDDI
jgi:hypothetical protein